MSGLLAEAEQSKRVTRFVRDVLVRLLSQSLPNGWPAVLDDANRFKVAKALGSWFAYTPETYKERVDRAGDVLLSSPPPPGWFPLGPDDELLRMLLPDDEA
ncbi:NUDIX hydrolase [Corallococcus praedator]|uniref:NUDIX hydrolase n=1 Tax=Corallococcus praedator TaxID=2316724 RepID=A0ABX9Q354_9BACT|nr:NUDIX hydrolase [Corallococcus sp. CA031C]RKH87454.1 NUDIX hydrolase [Corallococcus praedator]